MKQLLKFTSIKALVFLYCLVLASAAAIIYTAVRVDAITYTQNQNYHNHLHYYTANALFRQGRIGFLDIADFVESAMQQAPFIPNPTLDDLFETDKEIRNK